MTRLDFSLVRSCKFTLYVIFRCIDNYYIPRFWSTACLYGKSKADWSQWSVFIPMWYDGDANNDLPIKESTDPNCSKLWRISGLSHNNRFAGKFLKVFLLILAYGRLFSLPIDTYYHDSRRVFVRWNIKVQKVLSIIFSNKAAISSLRILIQNQNIHIFYPCYTSFYSDWLLDCRIYSTSPVIEVFPQVHPITASSSGIYLPPL